MGLEVHKQEVTGVVAAWKAAAPAGLSSKDYDYRHALQGRAVITGNQPSPSRASPTPPGSKDGLHQWQSSQRRACGLGCEARAGGGEELRGFRTRSAAGWVGAFGAPFIEAAVAGLGTGSGKRRRGWKMPVHSRGDKKETNHHDEMEVDYAENEGSSSEDEDTESSSVSEDGDSSGVQPSGAGTLSPRAGLTTGRSPHAGQLRPAGSAGRGEREGAETGSRPSAAPGLAVGSCLAPGGSLLAGRDRARAWACPAPGRCAVLFAVGPAPVPPGSAGGCGPKPGIPRSFLGDLGNASWPQTTDFFSYFYLSSPSQPGRVVRAEVS